MIGSKSTSGIRRPRLAHDVHHPVQRTRVLHRNQAVAFEHEFGYPHQHGEEIVEQWRRIRAEKLAPYRNRRTETEGCARIELRRHDVDDAALLVPDRIAGITERE